MKVVVGGAYSMSYALQKALGAQPVLLEGGEPAKNYDGKVLLDLDPWDNDEVRTDEAYVRAVEESHHDDDLRVVEIPDGAHWIIIEGPGCRCHESLLWSMSEIHWGDDDATD